MAKVKIQGNASGTGVFTITPPATSTDRTLTLPDSAGTLVNTAPSTSGNVLTSDGTNWTSAAAAAGGVDGIVSTADATAITITSAEKVGILDTSPQAELSISPAGTNAAAHTTGLQIRHNGYSGYKSGLSAGDTAATTYNCGFIGFLGGDHVGAGKRHIVFETRPGTTDAAPTERLRITDDGRGLSQFTAKAWVNFNGASEYTYDSHNVSSIGYNSTGSYTVNFTNNMANANYASAMGGHADHIIGVLSGGTQATSSIPISSRNSNGSVENTQYCTVVIFGD